MTKEEQEKIESDIQKILDKNGGVFFKEQFEEANRNCICKEVFDNLIKKSQKEKTEREKYLESLVEMARINDKHIFKYDVFVNGGDSYGTGRNEHGEPHFHYADNYKTPQKFGLSILIPEVDIWNENKELIIIESIDKKMSWNGLRKEKEMLIEWLDEPNHLDPDKTNLQTIRLQWNILNSDNNNVRQIKLK